MGQLRAWATALPRPSAVLVLSAHWERRPVTLGATTPAPLVHDFAGFPVTYYQVRYPAPGAPALAARVRQLLEPAGPVDEAPDRGLDHGAYVPLQAMYPAADVPVLQASLPTLEPAVLFELGRRLRPLRDEQVLVMGSGFLTHNLRLFDWYGESPTPAWARDFDAWVAGVLARGDVDALLDYRRRAPHVRVALPTHEHFAPLLVAMGAAEAGRDPVTFPITGFSMSTMSKRSVQVG